MVNIIRTLYVIVIKEQRVDAKKVFIHFFEFIRERNFLDVQGEYDKIISVVRGKFCLIGV
jgi:hypothetical protein